MGKIFEIMSQIVNDGLFPCLKLYIDFLLGDGLLLGLGIIFLPLAGRVIYLFKKIFNEEVFLCQ